MKAQITLYLNEESLSRLSNFSIASGKSRSKLIEEMINKLPPIDSIKKESKGNNIICKFIKMIDDFYIENGVGITKVILARRTSKYCNGEHRAIIINNLIAQGRIKEIRTIGRGRGLKPGTAYIPLQKYDDGINLQTY